MKIAIILLISIALLLPFRVHAGMVGTPDPLEKSLQEIPKTESQRMTEDFQKDMKKPDQLQAGNRSSGSNWWKWTLGVLVVGGIAAAAGGGGSESSGISGGGGSGGTVVSTW